LKTPLARLQVELEQAVESAPAGSPQQEIFSSLLDEISRLKAIVQKLLLLSIADAGQLGLKYELVNLTRLLENVIEDCRAQAPHLAVEQALAPDVCVNADPDLLEQALQNLATNAIKYNQPDGRIRFELVKEADRAIVRVANTGPGVPTADRERIFERFYRADPARSGRVEGVGLGLSLSREIVRAHGLDRQVSLQAGDFLADDIGSGYDLVLVSQILHAYDEDRNRLLLRKVAGALVPGGTVVVQEFFLNESRAAPAPSAVFAINMLVNTEKGRTYTWDEVETWLAEAGFVRIRRMLLSGPAGVLVAVRP
jgi:hypothetical protein